MGTAGQVAHDLPALPDFRERRFTGGIRSECGHVSHNGTWGALAGAEGFRAGNRWHGTPDSNSDRQANPRRRAWEPITSSSPPMMPSEDRRSSPLPDRKSVV